jgi:tRNA (Thr-GGU) A37 N-methylase
LKKARAIPVAAIGREGIFAQRSKDRPNCIGVTVCKTESVDGLKFASASWTLWTALPFSM